MLGPINWSTWRKPNFLFFLLGIVGEGRGVQTSNPTTEGTNTIGADLGFCLNEDN